MSIMNRIRSTDSSLSILAGLFVVAAALGACDDDPVEPDTLAWEAALVGSGTFAGVTGDAAVVSGATSLAADIEIEGAEADAVFTWIIREGSCATPGDAVGTATSYPDLEADAQGAADAQATIAAGLDEDGDYVVIVRDESGAAPVTVACAAMAHD